MAKSKKIYYLLNYFEELASDSSFSTAKMFGALAVYYKGLNIAVIAESPGEKSYRDQKFDFEIWHGILFPTEREYHAVLMKLFSQLRPHPVLGKWLYLPYESEEFEEVLEAIVRRIKKQDFRWGILPGQKKRKKKVTPVSKLKKRKSSKKG